MSSLAALEEKIRELLRRDGIKLWLSPYYNDDVQASSNSMAFDELIAKVVAETGADIGEVSQCLRRLQEHSVEKLARSTQYKETGVATLHVTMVNPSSSTDDAKSASIAAPLSVCGAELRSRIADVLAIDENRFQMVAAGRKLDDERTLESQHLVHGSDVICIMVSEEELAAAEERKTRAAIEKLIHMSGGSSNHHVEITDQRGNVISLPDSEHKALAFAMSLHEKGRAAIKRKDYARGLLYLLDADEQFSQCRSEILGSVDNYAILHLDIVWCYLCLKNISALPDAERRLQICDTCFTRSYGKNFERLVSLKKTAEQERALLVRLHLLQGIVAFYKKNYSFARTTLERVEGDIKRMSVDDSKLSQLMCMVDASAAEARLALRATDGNLEAATNAILQQREEDHVRKIAEQEERARGKLEKMLGLTDDGKPISIDGFKQLEKMGFEKGAIRTALRKANNDCATALQLLTAPDFTAEVASSADGNAVQKISDELTAKLASLGYDFAQTKQLIEQIAGSADSFDELLESMFGGDLAKQLRAQFAHLMQRASASQSVAAAAPTLAAAEKAVDGAAAEATADGVAAEVPGASQAPQWSREDEEAWAELDESIAKTPYDHLDVTFDDEMAFVHEYKLLLTAHL